MSGSAVVFVGRVLVESGADWGPARVAVEEGLFNVPKDLREVEIDTFAGSSCYRHIEAGERYVIFAGRSSDGKLFVALCSWTFRVLGNEHILSALRNQREGGSSRLLGTVRRISDANADERGVAGATVIVDSAVGDSLAITDGFGNYEIRGLDPGLYHVRVRKEGLMPGPEYNHRWSGEEDNEQGIVTVGANSCEILDLAMWANSRISGSVYDNRGGPVDGVAVQAFSVFGRRGQSIDST